VRTELETLQTEMASALRQSHNILRDICTETYDAAEVPPLQMHSGSTVEDKILLKASILANNNKRKASSNLDEILTEGPLKRVQRSGAQQSPPPRTEEISSQMEAEDLKGGLTAKSALSSSKSELVNSQRKKGSASAKEVTTKEEVMTASDYD
jgi:recombination DNA repair RAD52 pathway protein